eukprot:TRINITY_DN107007_c0_g1_i1.p2 TRINITY_DN107007_c0_g1~~TRINITY_DN107007_c0_g1_i1.p2  ORF type:complete len:126 (-),score=23.30 TRINITY_DN107007_c0_g1_i1:81-458(-)
MIDDVAAFLQDHGGCAPLGTITRSFKNIRKPQLDGIFYIQSQDGEVIVSILPFGNGEKDKSGCNGKANVGYKGTDKGKDKGRKKGKGKVNFWDNGTSCHYGDSGRAVSWRNTGTAKGGYGKDSWK